MLKQILIPVTAFAVTVTAASAFSGDMLSKINVDLTDAQKSALEEAHTIREEAQTKAQEVLKNAGIDEEKMREIHQAMRGMHMEGHEAVRSALEANDYDAFLKAIKDTPLAETIDTEDEFKKFVEAHELMESGDREGAKEIMDELGIKAPMGGRGHGMGMGEGRGMRGW